MAAAIALAIILITMALLVFMGSRETLPGGLTPDQLASLAALSAFGLLSAVWIARRFRGQWALALQAVAFWLAVTVGLVGLYTYRFELEAFANRILAEVAPGYAVVARGSEVSFAQRPDGHFILNTRINGKQARLIFDTGASVVTLTNETARAIGIDPATLSYTVPVSTANGRTMAAAIVLDSLSIGSITERRVRALVAQPGVLRENLLGLSFLERLSSFEVRNGRLFLRAE